MAHMVLNPFILPLFGFLKNVLHVIFKEPPLDL